jgi:hypothetical protein
LLGGNNLNINFIKMAVYPKEEKSNKKPKLGSGKRFANLEKKLSAKGATDPGALAAWIGRKNLGKKRFQKLAAKGKKK